MHGVEYLLLAFLLEAGKADHLDLLLGADDGKVGGTVVGFGDYLSLDFLRVGKRDAVVVEDKHADDWSSVEERVVLA